MSATHKNGLSGVTFSLKAFTLKQLSELYGVSTKTFSKWLKPFSEEIGAKHGHFFNINQVKCIITRLGIPGDVVVE